jgi:hypothetical protein
LEPAAAAWNILVCVVLAIAPMLEMHCALLLSMAAKVFDHSLFVPLSIQSLWVMERLIQDP